MATYYVDTDGGGDYTSLAAACSQIDSDFSGGLTEICYVYCSGSTADSSSTVGVTVSTSDTNYLVIEALAGNRAGSSWDTSKYRIEASSPFSCAGNFSIIRGLQIGSTDWTVVNAFDYYQVYEACYIQQHESAQVGVYNYGSDEDSTVSTFFNCIFDATLSTSELSTAGIVFNGTTSSYSMLNCTSIGADYGVLNSNASSCTVHNIISEGNTEAFTGTFTGSYNISNDTTTAGSPCLTSTTISFESGTYQPTAGSAADEYGTNLYSTFTTDIVGNERPSSGSWTAGAVQLFPDAIEAALSGAGFVEPNGSVLFGLWSNEKSFTGVAEIYPDTTVNRALPIGSLTGNGSVMTSLGRFKDTTISLNADSLLSLTLGRLKDASSTFSGSGTFSSAMVFAQELTSALSGTGALTLSPILVVALGLALSGIGSVDPLLSQRASISSSPLGLGSISSRFFVLRYLQTLVQGRAAISDTVRYFYKGAYPTHTTEWPEAGIITILNNWSY